jgi:hypothetical protein
MKKMKISQFLTIGLLVLGALSFSGCKKEIKKQVEEHETNTPHSSVKSIEITVSGSEWNDDNGVYSVTKPCSIITQDILNSGAVMCYLKDGNKYFTLPLTLALSDGTFEWISHYLFTHSVGSAEFQIYDDDGLSGNPGTRTYKIVTIESTGLIQNPNVDLTSYASVKEAFNLEN